MVHEGPALRVTSRIEASAGYVHRDHAGPDAVPGLQVHVLRMKDGVPRSGWETAPTTSRIARPPLREVAEER